MGQTSMNTGLVRLTYANVWSPRDSFGEDKYSATLLIPKNDRKTIEQIKACIETVKAENSDKLKGAKNPKTTLKDGDGIDSEGNEYPEYYKGHYALNTTSKKRPGIVDKNIQKIFDEDEVYSGCYAIVNVNFYAYNSNGNKGIACGLNHIMKIKDGENLAGGITVEQAFSGVDLSDFLSDDETFDDDLESLLG